MPTHLEQRGNDVYCAGCTCWVNQRWISRHQHCPRAQPLLAQPPLPAPPPAAAASSTTPSSSWPPRLSPLPEMPLLPPLAPLPPGAVPDAARVRQVGLRWLQINAGYCRANAAAELDAVRASIIVGSSLSNKATDSLLRSEALLAERRARALARGPGSPEATAAALVERLNLNADAAEILKHAMRGVALRAAEAARPAACKRSKAELMRELDHLAEEEGLTFSEVKVPFWNGATPLNCLSLRRRGRGVVRVRVRVRARVRVRVRVRVNLQSSSSPSKPGP